MQQNALPQALSRMWRVLGCAVLCLVALVLLGGCPGGAHEPEPDPPPGPPPVYGYRVVNEFPHDPGAFTQGLEYLDGFLYESTGLHGRSSLRKADLETGEVLQRVNLPLHLFGEGLTVFGGHIFQLTWTSGVALVYDKERFEVDHTFNYTTEGWGLTNDGVHLIMSDGTHVLRFRDPETFETVREIEVYDEDGAPVVRLNELEYIDGEIYANIWMTERIVRIDPATGRVLAWIDLSGLPQHAAQGRRIDVLNGIAYDATGNRLFVTGKLWPSLYEIELILPD